MGKLSMVMSRAVFISFVHKVNNVADYYPGTQGAVLFTIPQLPGGRCTQIGKEQRCCFLCLEQGNRPRKRPIGLFLVVEECYVYCICMSNNALRRFIWCL